MLLVVMAGLLDAVVDAQADLGRVRFRSDASSRLRSDTWEGRGSQAA